MPPLRLTGGVAAALALAATFAAPTSAHHSTSATAALTLDPPSAACVDREKAVRSRCSGARTARVEWSSSCAYPDAWAEVEFWKARPGRAPVRLGTEEESGTQGSTARRMAAGVRLYATVTAFCHTDGDFDTIEPHAVSASSGPTAEAVTPPRLVAVEAVTGNFCGLVPSAQRARTILHARQAAGIEYGLAVDTASFLGAARRSSAALRRTILFARGAGLKLRQRAARSVLGPMGQIPVGAGLRLAPRRPGTLRVWAVVGGVRTNMLAFRVLRNRRCTTRYGF